MLLVGVDVLDFAFFDRRALGVEVALVCAPAAIAGAERRWGVWSGLATELGEVEITSGAVADGHRFAQLAFGVEAVEDDTIDGDSDDLDDDFDDGADK